MDSHSSIVSTPIAIIIGSIMISVSILVSSGVIELQGVKSGSLRNMGAQASAAPALTNPQASAEPDNTGPVTVTLDDDPIIGDKNAPITMVEFSDYECPFCKRYFDQTYPDIKKDYIDTGKLKVVYRDLPLSFHQNAHKEAEAANCAREQGGDVAYFKFHDEMFTKTTSNGTGLSLDELPTLAANVGLNGSLLKTCMDSNKYISEVDKDLADATKFGADGTPTFFIGKTGDGKEIEGTRLIGAQPLSAFQTILDGVK